MANKTCAACDDDVGENLIKETIGQKTVEVCCEDCARTLREAEKAKTAGK